MLGYTGDQLRSLTLAEFSLALDGHLESKGIRKPKDRLMGRNKLLELADRFGG